MKNVAALALVLTACAASPTPRSDVSSGPTNPSAGVSSEAPKTGRTVRVARIDPWPFEAIVKPDLAAAKKWGADPANKAEVLPVIRHILVKAARGNDEARAAARRKADDILARLDRGEAFAALAKMSDDPGSASQGGAYPGRQVKTFVPEMRRAYAELAPGQRARAPIETSFGWHIVEKGTIDDDACVDGYRAWLAKSMAEKIGKNLERRLRHVESGGVAGAIDGAFTDVLGADRSKAGQRPVVTRMVAETCDGFATIGRGEGITWRDDALVVAALTNDERDAAELEAESCDDRRARVSPRSWPKISSG